MSKQEQQSEMLANRVQKNARRLKSYIRDQNLDCYRLYDRDIPEMPLAIDWYLGRLHVSEYKRGYQGDDRQGEAWIRDIIRKVCQRLGVSEDKVWIKTRERQRGSHQYQAQGDPDHRFIVSEYGERLWVNLHDYLDTGIFLDHRPLRLQVRQESRDKSFLNLFSYTGVFTLQAIGGGCSSSLSIDLSPTYAQWMRENLELMESQPSGDHEIRQGDVMKELSKLSAQGRRFDLAVVDPPTFSNSKRSESDFDIQRDHGALLGAVAKVMEPGGRFYFSTNSRRFKLDADWESKCDDITHRTIPPDFRDSRIHRAWQISMERVR